MGESMRRLCIILMIAGVFGPTFAAWEMIGPFGGPLRAIAIAPSNENILYTASYIVPSIVLRSTNQGNSWDKGGSIGNYVFSLAVDPTNPDIVYAGSYMRVYKSTDGGQTWTDWVMTDYYVNGLYVNPNSPSTVYAVGAERVGSYYYMAFYKSTNGGASWTTKIINGTDRGMSYCLGVDPTDPNSIYVGGYIYTTVTAPALYKSTDGGSNFSDISSGISNGYYVYGLGIHPTNPSIVYAGTYGGYIYRSTNGGSSWSQVHSGSLLYSFATTQASPNVAYAGGDTVVYKTTNSGATWFEVSAGVGGSYKFNRGLVASQSSASIVLTSDYTGCSKTTNGGSNWFDANFGINIGAITSFGISPLAPATIFTEFEGVAVYKTTDNGFNWAVLPTPLDCGNICAFAFHNTDPDIVLGLEGKG